MPCKNGKTTAAVCLVLLSFILVVVPDVKVVEAEPNLIVVLDDYQTITDAIGNATEGDTYS